MTDVPLKLSAPEVAPSFAKFGYNLKHFFKLGERFMDPGFLTVDLDLSFSLRFSNIFADRLLALLALSSSDVLDNLKICWEVRIYREPDD